MRVSETIEVARPLDEAFAYVADLSNSAEWDPGIAVARKLGEREYELIAEWRGKRIPFHYRVTELDEGGRVVAVGEGEKARSVDTIQFERAGTGTRITWQAQISLKGPRRPFGLLMWPLFKRMGAKALAGLKATLDARG